MIQIYEQDASAILPLLAAQLPYSVVLTRRIQHSITYPSPTAKILATFQGSSPDTPWLAAVVDLFRGREIQILVYSSLEAEHTSIIPIIPEVGSTSPDSSAAQLSLSRLAASSISTTPGQGQDQNEAKYSVSTLTAPPAVLRQTRAQLLALLAYVKANLLPEYLSSLSGVPRIGTGTRTGTGTPTSPAKSDIENDVPLIPAPDPRAFLIGSLHTGLFNLLLDSGVFPAPTDNEGNDIDPVPIAGLRIHRYDNPPYKKYLFRRSVFTPPKGESEAVLPPGYRFADRQGRTGVLDSQLDLVQSRTHIPRSRAQLSTMPGVAIYYDPPQVRVDETTEEWPIAWAFLGVEGSLATLHVEPEHRGKGLALSLSRETMRRGMADGGVFCAEKAGIEDEGLKSAVQGWTHADVAQYNTASKKVMEKVGGSVVSTVVWTVIED
ncbi:hypothetical protein N7495_009548, partial [Penicillium taxi]|uniref:uncharacterized protein n=1 Tax=Penicillium taxi TaxID=168475 RepID=UPI002544D389